MKTWTENIGGQVDNLNWNTAQIQKGFNGAEWFFYTDWVS